MTESETQDDALDPFRGTEYVAVGYLTDAKSYRRASAILSKEGEHIAHHSPIYFLHCHTIELLLKAFILANGGTEKDLRQHEVRHQLVELLEMAKSHGLTPTEHTEAVVAMLAPHHENHSFRYHVTGYKTFPLIGEIARAVADVMQQVEPAVNRNLMQKQPRAV